MHTFTEFSMVEPKQIVNVLKRHQSEEYLPTYIEIYHGAENGKIEFLATLYSNSI